MGIGWANMKFASGRDGIEEIKISISHTYQTEQMCIIKNAQMFNQTKKKNQQKKNKALRAILNRKDGQLYHTTHLKPTEGKEMPLEKKFHTAQHTETTATTKTNQTYQNFFQKNCQ